MRKPALCSLKSRIVASYRAGKPFATRNAKAILLFLPFLFFILSIFTANAQYYDWGQEPASVKWRQLKTDDVTYVYPDYYATQAFRLMHYMDTIRPYIGHGFRKGPMRTPLVMHTQNMSPNGLVMLAPKRMEFIVPPPAATAAMPWLKQLAAHEYRHAVQFNNLNRNVPKVLSYILGSQGALTGMAFMPYWAVEGDAVLAETQMSTFGRGLQPSFTIDYRAVSLEGDRNFSIDKFFCGSFRDQMPDHYHLGYQITSWAYTKYGENVWEKVGDFGTRRPYIIFTTKRALKKYYNTSSNNLFRETFASLDSLWKSEAPGANSMKIIGGKGRSFRTYATPVQLEGKGHIYTLSTELGKPTAILEVDWNSCIEKTVHRTGSVNTGLVVHDGKLWWTELRQSTFWEQRVNSVLCEYNPTTGKGGPMIIRDMDGKRENIMFVSTNASGKGIPAYVTYHREGYYSITADGIRTSLPETISVHGLAYDSRTKCYYFIGLDDYGMWIGALNNNTGYGDSDAAKQAPAQVGFHKVTRPSFSTLSALRAADGKLYYGSIASGLDEIHIYDLNEKKEYLASESRYGSFDPFPTTHGFLGTTYTKEGYMLSYTPDTETAKMEQTYTLIPENKVNPRRVKWRVPNLDSVIISEAQVTDAIRTSDGSRGYKEKRFRKLPHTFQIHSWAPAWFEPERVLDDGEINVHAGVTLLSQNLLNSTIGVFGYKYSDEGHSFTAGLKFYGLPVKIEVETEYSTRDQAIYYSWANDRGYDPGIGNHFDIFTRAYLPILLSNGYYTTRLTPIVEFEHLNAYVQYRPTTMEKPFRRGMQKVAYSLQHSGSSRMSHRDFLPKWGHMVRVANTSNPFNSRFGSITSVYLRGYLPGLFPHHSLMLRTAFQKHKTSMFGFRQKELFPRGAYFNISPDRYMAYSVDYQLPVAYPDGGIPSLLYFKRIRTNLTYDFARYRSTRGKWDNITSYGMDVTFDIVPIRLPPSTSTSVTISIHKPSNRSGAVFSASLTMPI